MNHYQVLMILDIRENDPVSLEAQVTNTRKGTRKKFNNTTWKAKLNIISEQCNNN